MVAVLDRVAPVAVSVSWLERASCRGKPLSWWFPERFDPVTGRIGKAICATCPVRADCLAAALVEEADAGYRNGVRGGMSAAERARLAPTPTETAVAAPVVVVVSGRAATPTAPTPSPCSSSVRD